MSGAGWVQFVVLGVLVAISTPLLAKYMYRVYFTKKAPGDRVFLPVENFIYRICGVDPDGEQRWRSYALAMLAFSLVSVLFTYALLRLQGHLPFNPDHQVAVSPALSFNTAVSFLTNTNWQTYAGESTMSHLSQMLAHVVTASAGNMAQGVAYAARLRGVPATIVVPEGAPATKLAAIERFGGRVVALPYDDWWRVLVEGEYDGASGLFVHPVDNVRVMAGNGTIGLELLEDLPDVDAVLVPYGGGGLVTGIASAVKASRRDVRFYSVEPETGAPAADALAGGRGEVDYTRSWVDGAGSRSLIPGVWEHASKLLDGALVVPLAEVAAAVRLLAERMRVVAEGAGALSVAAAVAGKAGGGKVVCVVSGGNIDSAVLARILTGENP